MSNKHTPGPWTVTADGAGWYIECSPERGHSVAYIRAEIGEEDPDTSDDEKEANSRLIASAPELLEALKLIASAENSALDLAYCKGIARAAITKATGGAT